MSTSAKDGDHKKIMIMHSYIILNRDSFYIAVLELLFHAIIVALEYVHVNHCHESFFVKSLVTQQHKEIQSDKHS